MITYYEISDQRLKSGGVCVVIFAFHLQRGGNRVLEVLYHHIIAGSCMAYAVGLILDAYTSDAAIKVHN